MQKFLRYEMTVAMKDRPKIFQVITLVLFSFSVTVIVISSLVHFTSDAQPAQAYKPLKGTGYTGYVGAPAGHLLHIKK
jgi:hypothetical protein